MLAGDDDALDAARVPAPTDGFTRLLRRALRDAAGRRRLVVRADPGRRLPGPVPVHVPANHGMLTRHRLARVVHGGRAARPATSSGRRRVSLRCRPRRRCARYAGSAQGVEIRDDADTVARFDGVVIATHPDQALAMLAQPTHAETRRARRDRLHPQPDRCCTPTPRCCRARRGRRRPGTTDCPPARPRRPRCQLSYNMNRLQRLDTAETYVVTLNGDDARRRRTGHRSRWTTSTRSTRPTRWRARHGCPSSTTARWPSPAPTTAGDSTRTAAAPASSAAREPGGALVSATAKPIYDGRDRPRPRRRRCATRSGTAATSGSSTSTTCRGCRAAALAGPVRRARSLRRPAARSCGERRRASSPSTGIDLARRPDHDAGQRRAALGYVFNPLIAVLVPRPRRRAGRA